MSSSTLSFEDGDYVTQPRMRMEEKRGLCGEEAMGEVKITKWRWWLGFWES